MSVRRRKPPTQEVDLEATAELPVIDFDAVQTDDRLGATDTVATLAVPAGVSELADSLRDVESRLHRKGERVRELEEQIVAAEASARALRDSLEEERRNLADERRQSAEALERERKAAAEHLESERRAAVAQLESARQEARHAGDEAARQAEATRKALAEAQQSLAARGSELAATSQALAEQKQQVVELHRAAEAAARELRHQGRDIDDLRRRAEQQAEALRHAQGVRAVFEGLVADRDETLSGIESRHAAALAAAQSRETAQYQEFRTRESALRSEHAALEASLKAANAAIETALKAERAESEAALTAAFEARLQQLEAEHSARETALDAELAELRAGTQSRIDTLEAGHQRLSEALAAATADLEAARERGDELAARVQEQDAQIATRDEELAELRATDEAAREGVAAFAGQQNRLRDLEEELIATRGRALQSEQDLRAAEEQIRRLESEARVSASLLGNLQQNIARLGREDTGSRPALKLVGAIEPLPERFLVGEEGGAEVRHPIGRRTTIGRIADNDIQIDAAFISRHHAVMLGGAQHCIIEDLNSTNGVLVNGRRVNRQTLRDGDNVTIGRTVFRYQQPT